MTARMFYLVRSEDKSGISGTGIVCEGVAWTGGKVTLHWLTDWPSVATFDSLDAMLAVHGHQGATIVRWLSDRLPEAYRRVMPHLLAEAQTPVTVGPHPDHPDRLRVVLRGERDWRFWIALLDGSSHAAVHEVVNGEIEHRWCSPDGDLWLSYFTPTGELYNPPPPDENPLQTFDREDR